MISRRAMVVGGALAVAGSWPLSRVGSAAEKSFLPQGLPEGVYDYRHARGPARQKTADQAHLSSAQLRNAALSLHLGIHAQTSPFSFVTTSPESRKKSTPRSGS